MRVPESLGHRIIGNGISPDSTKMEAIRNMPDPKNFTELKRNLAMTIVLGQFVANMSTIFQLVTDLLQSDRGWTWGPTEIAALAMAKEMLSTPPTLAFFDLTKPSTASTDASSYRLGGVLIQEYGGVQRPVVYCLRILTPAEQGYAQI